MDRVRNQNGRNAFKMLTGKQRYVYKGLGEDMRIILKKQSQYKKLDRYCPGYELLHSHCEWGIKPLGFKNIFLIFEGFVNLNAVYP